MAEARIPGKTRKIKFLGTNRHMKRGLSFFKKGEYQNAIEQYELVLLHDKTCVRAYNNLGFVYKMIGDDEKALEIWGRGLKIDESYERLQKNIFSLQKRLRKKGKGAGPTPVGIKGFEADIEWLSGRAELIETRPGRFFETYLIEDSGARYALKTPCKPLSSNQDTLREFERACSGWLKLGPNKYVVRARSLELIAGRPFLATDCAREISLRSLLETGWKIFPNDAVLTGDSSPAKTLSISQIIEFAIQMCIGLHFIHGAGDMAHRDVRSDNVMFHEIPAGGGEAQGAGRYFLKITNVGLWAAFQNKKIFCDPSGAVLPEFAAEGLARTLSGFMTPSLLWCAPELLESVSAPNVSTDAYAFGVIFYEMLTGLLPFSGSTPSDLLKNIQEVAPEHPSVINTGVPIAAGNIAMKCLEEKPSARFKNFFEIGDALIRHIEESAYALKELAELCGGRYRKISRFQFNDEQSGETMMIVGGTEFSSEVGQLWEINRRRAETENNASLKERLENIERALSMPGHTIGEVYPNLSGIADALSALAPYEYREELHAIGSEARDEAPEETDAEMDFTLEVSVEAPGEDAPVIPREIPASSTAEVFGPEIAARYSSLIIVADSNQAARMLARGFTLCAEALLLESPNGSALVEAFSEVAASSRFPHWLGLIFEELSAVSDCPGPRDFLENGMQTEREIIAAVCGFVFMLGDKFTEALETFNMISDSRYPLALNIYVWAMSKFRSPEMETIRLNSLRNASGLLKESIIADKNSSQRGTLIISSHPGAALADTLFLRGLVLEQLGKHKRAVAHLTECKKLLSAGEGVSRNLRPWTELVLGKCLYELGMPSEGFIRWQRALIHELRPPSFAFLELGPSKPGALIADHVLQCCEGALSRFKASAMLWCVKGKLLNRIGRGPDAIECAERAFGIEENYGPAHFIVMEASLLAGKYDDALKALKICTLREPHEPLFMLREAEILCLLGQAEEAFHELKRAVSHKLDPAELKASVRRERLAALEQFGEFAEITGGLELD